MATVRHLGLFPNCLPTSNPGNRTFLNSATVASSVALFWRVKTFRIFADFNGEFGLEIKRDIETEKDLVCLKEPTTWSYQSFGFGVGDFDFLAEPVLAMDNAIYWDFSVLCVNDNEQKLFQIFSDTDQASMGSYDFVDYAFGNNSIRLAVATGQDIITPTLQVTEWWPYDPGDSGGPIYHKATGRQLRAFP